MKRHVLIFGAVGGLIIAVLQYNEFRFVIVEHSVEIYGSLIAVVFSAFGIWLGLRITRKPDSQIPVAAPGQAAAVVARSPEAFVPNAAGQQGAGITQRELEVLTLVARGMSNREIASKLFVSESTVKTHCSRVFEKLGASRRTQAVVRGKELGLLPPVDSSVSAFSGGLLENHPKV